LNGHFPEIFALYFVSMYYRVHKKNVVAVKEITVTKFGYEQQSFFRLPSERLSVSQSEN